MFIIGPASWIISFKARQRQVSGLPNASLVRIMLRTCMAAVRGTAQASRKTILPGGEAEDNFACEVDTVLDEWRFIELQPGE